MRKVQALDPLPNPSDLSFGGLPHPFGETFHGIVEKEGQTIRDDLDWALRHIKELEEHKEETDRRMTALSSMVATLITKLKKAEEA